MPVGRTRRGSSRQRTAAATNSSGMEGEMAGSSLGDFQFFKILLPGMYEESLRMPAKFARELGARRDLKLRLAGEGMPVWDVEVFAGEKRGDMYLAHGWAKFARAHDLRNGYILVFRYDGGGGELIVTVFDLSTCQKQYLQAAGAGGGGRTSNGAGDGRRSLSVAEPSHFAVTLRRCNFGTKQNQYLNVPVEFQNAHGYARLRLVELQMGGRSWTVNLKRSKRLTGDRTAFKYGWHQFCVDNGLQVGDTCFFRVIRVGSCGDDEDEEWEEEEEDDDHVLKVEVRKKNGAFVS